jgi:PKD repeat protein
MNLRTLFLLAFILPSFLYSQHWSDVLDDRSKNFFEKQAAFEEYWEGREYERGKGYKQFKRWEWFWEPRVSATGEFPEPQQLYLENQRFMKENRQRNLQKSNASWNPLGPNQYDAGSFIRGLGRTAEVAEDPTDSDIIYVGTPAGGLWKSTDAGSNWIPLTDHLPSLGVSGIVVDPIDTQIIYIATGDGDADDTYGIGVMKSTDGGFTWSETGMSWDIESNRVSHKLIMHPDNNQILFVASDAGLYKTTNAGETWYSVRSGNIQDVEFHPTDPSIMYANGSTFYRSTDGGESFSAGASGLPANSAVSRYSTAVSADEPDWVYLLAGASSTEGFLGLYRSTDQGQTFSLRSDSPNIMGFNGDGSDSGGQAWYDIALEVDPDNANRVFVGGVNLWTSTNAGLSWSIRAHWVYPSFTGVYVHADIHDLKYIGNKLYCLTDGGVHVSVNDGNAFTDITIGMEITQFYRIGLSASDSGLILAGAQDNGTFKLEDGEWEQIYGGDGMNCVVHPTNTNRFFVATQYGNIYRTTNGGNSFSNYSNGIPETGSWVTPYMLDPNNANNLYAGYSSLWRRSGTGSWIQVSPASNNISQFDIAESNSDYIYIIRSNSVEMTTDGGDNWTTITPGGSSTSKSWIEINPNDENEIFVTVSGFLPGNKVYHSTDGGQTWENISYNLPNFPANTITMEEGGNGGVYVGMDVGVYYINDDLANWIPYEEGLPKVPITELEIHQSSGKLRAATYGRGVWESDIFTELDAPPVADFQVDKRVACAGEELSFTDLSINHAPGWDWTFEGGTPASSDEQNPTVVFEESGLFDISLSVDNTLGSDTETVAEYVQILSDVGEELPFSEGFEGIDLLENSDRWFIENEDNDVTWEVNETIGRNSSSSLWLNNYNNSLDNRDRLYSTTIDLSDAAEVTLSLDVAFAQVDEDNKDRLRIYASTDCGSDWDIKKTFSGHTTLPSVSPMTEEFFPSSDDDWHTLQVTNIDDDDLIEGFRFYIYFENDGGNNIFIDNINLSFISVGLEDIDLKNLDVQLYPNPSSGQSTLRFNLLGDRNVDLLIRDVTGREIYTEYLGTLSFGEHRMDLDLDIPSGMYTVELRVDGKSSVSKWSID